MQKEIAGITVTIDQQASAIETPGGLLELVDEPSPDSLSAPCGGDEDLIDPKLGFEGGEGQKPRRLSRQPGHQPGIGTGHGRPG